KTYGMLLEGGWIVVGIGLQHAAAGDAVSAHAVQDRFWEAGLLGKLGIAMQRIAVAAQTVDQGLIRTRRNIDRLVRRARRHLVRLGLRQVRPAKSAVAAGEARS